MTTVKHNGKSRELSAWSEFWKGFGLTFGVTAGSLAYDILFPSEGLGISFLFLLSVLPVVALMALVIGAFRLKDYGAGFLAGAAIGLFAGLFLLFTPVLPVIAALFAW